jgi:hypothetical protein
VLRFLERHPHPVAVEVGRHPGKAPDGIEREVDGVELDVADRMDQRGAARHRERRALRHQRGRNQVRLRRSTRQAGGSGMSSFAIEKEANCDQMALDWSTFP